MKKVLFIVLLLGTTILLSAQGRYVEPSFRYAYHIPFPLYADYPVYGADLRIGRQTDGSQAWESFFNYPCVGIAFRMEHHTMKDYFDEESQKFIDLGNSYAAFGYCNGHLFSRPKFQFDYTWGIGMAYWPKGHNRLISSPLTVHLTVDFGPVFKLNDNFDLFLRASFSHASNGALRVPNKGVNVLGGQVGLRYFPKGRANIMYDKEYPFEKYNLIYMLDGIGVRESNTITGRYCIGNTFEVGYSRAFHPCFRYGGGIDVLYTGENQVMYEYNHAEDRYKAVDAFSIAPYVAGELCYGRFIGHLSFAYYLWQPAEYLPKHYQKYYERLSFRYHFGKSRALFAGVGMKVHASRIDYIEWTVGADLWKW